MASARQIARLVTTCGSISSGAVRTAMGRTATPTGGLEVLPDLLTLLAETTCVASHADEKTVQRVGSYLARLVLRYGTIRRAFDALSSGRRRHALISNERASAWAQILSVSPAAIEHTLARQSWLRIHLAKWASDYGPELVQKLADFDAWLDGPLPDTDGEEDCPLLQRIARESDRRAEHASGEPEHTPPATEIEPDAERARDGSDDIVVSDGGLAMTDDHVREAPAHDADAALIAKLLDEKRPGEWASEWRLREEERACAERLLHDPDPLRKALGALALRELSTVGDLLGEFPAGHELERETRAGDRWYLKGDYDRAIDHYRAARRLRDDDVRRRNIALTLLHLERGHRDDTTREALDLLTQTVSDQPAGSHPRACALVILGLAWVASPSRDRDHALHEAVRCFEQAAQIFNVQEEPDWWCETRLHLAHAWLDMPTGDRFRNVEQAIGALRQTESIWTRAAQPERWASVQNALGHAWERLPSNDRGATLEKAIACFSGALGVRTRDDHPAHWARLQNNLGNAWIQLPSGDHRQNVERGIACHQAALETWSKLGRRQEWGATQSNLGNAWALLPGEKGEREKNMRRAIACYRSALEVRTRGNHPVEYAATMNNLGTALLHLPVAGRGSTVKEAIECFGHALTVRTKEAFPVDWAKTQSNLGLAWSRLPGDKQEHLTEAIACYDAALEVLTEQTHPGAHKHVRARREKAKDSLASMG
ncbi:MAG: hypothetical protein Tsb0013_20300 [Phycisphaerales bacterium]